MTEPHTTNYEIHKLLKQAWDTVSILTFTISPVAL